MDTAPTVVEGPPGHARSPRSVAPRSTASETVARNRCEHLRVLIVALTYRRPDEIAALAPLLVQHARQAAALDGVGIGFAVEVLVIDNDPDAGARPVLAAVPGLRYVHEPRPGIAAARNRALAEGHDADLLVFIDDDERPEDDWLTALLRTWATDRPAAVSGHVLSLFDRDLDPWIRAGDLFARPNPPTGTRLHTLAAGNLLLDLRQLRGWGLRFDDRFGLTGGEDTLLTRQIDACGGLMVWCRESVTTDRVPAERLTRRWLARRFFRFGVTAVRVELALLPTESRLRRAAVRARACCRGLVRLLAGAARWGVGLLTRRLVHQARGCKTLMRGAGLVAGACGHHHAEYSRTEQDS